MAGQGTIVLEIAGARITCTDIGTAAAFLNAVRDGAHTDPTTAPRTVHAARTAGPLPLHKQDRTVIELFLDAPEGTMDAAALRKALSLTPHSFAGWMAGFRRRLTAAGYDIALIRYGARRINGKVTALLRLEGSELEALRQRLLTMPT